MKYNSVSNGRQSQRLRPGEKGFAFVILAVCVYMIWQSALLYIKSPDPALMPLIASSAAAVAEVYVIVSNIKKKTEAADVKGAFGRAAFVAGWLVPTNAAVAFLAIAVYCVLLKLGLSFFAVTPAFLWGLMTFYKKGDCLKNLLWTGLCVAFIYAVFKLVFNVMI